MDHKGRNCAANYFLVADFRNSLARKLLWFHCSHTSLISNLLVRHRRQIKPKHFLILTLGVISLSGSCVSAITHNQDMAAIEAIEFARIAIINRDYEGARDRLALHTLNRTSVAKLESTLENIHTASWPNSIKAVRYEPLPGQRAMRIYLEGKSATEDFFYLFVMEGDADAGYRVSDIFRLKNPIPLSGLIQPLPVERTTN